MIQELPLLALQLRVDKEVEVLLGAAAQRVLRVPLQRPWQLLINPPFLLHVVVHAHRVVVAQLLHRHRQHLARAEHVCHGERRIFTGAPIRRDPLQDLFYASRAFHRATRVLLDGDAGNVVSLVDEVHDLARLLHRLRHLRRHAARHAEGHAHHRNRRV